MELAIGRVFVASVHVALRVGHPSSDVWHGESDCARTSLQVVHPKAVPPLVLMPPATLILHPILAARAAKQNALTVVKYVHFVVAPPTNRLQFTPNYPILLLYVLMTGAISLNRARHMHPKSPKVCVFCKSFANFEKDNLK